MYKDKDKQREANRKAQAKFKAKGITNQGITLPKNTDLGNTLTTTQTVSAVIPKLETPQVTEFTKTKFPENTRLPTHKRGKDIKCFADLPPDVQATIEALSDTPQEKGRRTAIAINYQHLYSDRFESTGTDIHKLEYPNWTGHIRVSKPGDADYVPMCQTTRRYIDGQ